MAYQIPTTEPTTVRAGDSWKWTRADLADFPASTWTLTYRFRNASGYFDVVANADGEAYAVSVAPATTGAIVAGRYDWAAFVDDGTDRHQVDQGATEVLPDIAAAAAHDGRIWARRMLEAVEATLEDRATNDQLDMVNTAISDMSLTRDTDRRSALIRLRAQLELEVKRAEGTGGMQRIVVRFGHA